LAQDEDKTPRPPRHSRLKQTTLIETIYQEVHARLQRGKVGLHDRLLDYEIAEEFDCTRTTVRQALLRLVNEGFLVGTTRGFVIPSITEQDIREIFEVRRLLEPPAAANAAAVLSKAHEQRLKAAYRSVQQAFKAKDIEQMFAANVAFREAWLDAVTNTRLRGAILRFVDHAQLIRLGTLSHVETQKVVADGIKALLAGFIARDPERVRTTMLAFMLEAEETYFAWLDRASPRART